MTPTTAHVPPIPTPIPASLFEPSSPCSCTFRFGSSSSLCSFLRKKSFRKFPSACLKSFVPLPSSAPLTPFPLPFSVPLPLLFLCSGSGNLGEDDDDDDDEGGSHSQLSGGEGELCPLTLRRISLGARSFLLTFTFTFTFTFLTALALGESAREPPNAGAMIKRKNVCSLFLLLFNFFFSFLFFV